MSSHIGFREERIRTVSNYELSTIVQHSCTNMMNARSLYILVSEFWKKLKACDHYFLSNFYFFTKWQLFKSYEKCFFFHLKSSFFSQDIQIFVLFCLPFHTFLIQKGKWKWNNLWCHEMTCINLQMQFLE